MKRSGFKRAPYERPPRQLYKLARAGIQASCAGGADPVLKENAVRSEAYRRLVAAMPCARCGISGYSNHSHMNLGKGLAIKVDDRMAMPLCTVHPGPVGDLVQGCHELLDQGALYSKEERRAIEIQWAVQTIEKIIADGLWPANLPRLDVNLLGKH